MLTEWMEWVRARPTVLVSGMTDAGRYEWIRPVVQTNWRAYLPSLSAPDRMNIPYLCYGQDEGPAMAVFADGTILPLQQADLSKPELALVVLPLSAHLVPRGLSVVLLPAFGGVSAWTSAADRFMRYGEAWLERAVKHVWIVSFPFGQDDGVATLRELRELKELRRLDTSVCFLVTDKRYGYTDISGAEKELEAATRQYEEAELCREVRVLNSRERSFAWLAEAPQKMADHAALRIRTDAEDYCDAVTARLDEACRELADDLLDQRALEPIFPLSRAERKRHGRLVDGWIHNLRETVLPGWNEQLKAFVLSKLLETSLFDTAASIDRLLSGYWDACLARLRRVDAEVDEKREFDEGSMFYRSAIAAGKARFLEWLSEDLHRKLPPVIENYIKRYYSVWL